jgi:hypothetical protein
MVQPFRNQEDLSQHDTSERPGTPADARTRHDQGARDELKEQAHEEKRLSGGVGVRGCYPVPRDLNCEADAATEEGNRKRRQLRTTV